MEGLHFSKGLTGQCGKPFKEDESRTNTFAEFTKAYLNIMRFKGLGYAFHDVAGAHMTISRNTFTTFVRNGQADYWDAGTFRERLALMGCAETDTIAEKKFVAYAFERLLRPRRGGEAGGRLPPHGPVHLLLLDQLLSRHKTRRGSASGRILISEVPKGASRRESVCGP
ncbi:hypothetical protein GH5_03563 [Leishmania sp. Ghana 2012 LV757]|uniref:hypothetical protein n=1 Tax=Leishmania sp. Ghana 2012 LV757 TaxID=2803181 RepID=UPI001B523CBC|nr:hypothetical protein GH5_03563 [Leishmania sp. Ghana 2012 LV757]